MRVLFLPSSTLTMFVGKPFPADYMLGWRKGYEREWSIAEIIAHPEFDVRMDMIIEQVRANGISALRLRLMGIILVNCM